MRSFLAFTFLLASFVSVFAHAPGSVQTRTYVAEGDYIVKDFKFKSGETLPELKLHYRTIGTATKDSSGVVNNAVLIMHGTGGTGAQFLSQQFANVLFG